MNVILARHGNTFAPSQASVWAGAKNDLPLVESGRQQARTLAGALSLANLVPSLIYSGPLKRTTEYASIVAQELKLPITPIIDSRLNEIDYGQWGGLTNEQVVTRFGQQAFDDWNSKCIWPPVGEWQSSPFEILSEINSLLEELRARHGSNPDDCENVLLVTSNGRLRYFLTIVPNEFEKHIQSHKFKVATGNVCLLRTTRDRSELRAWNVSPSQLAAL